LFVFCGELRFPVSGGGGGCLLLLYNLKYCKIWQDVQHQYTDIAQRVRQRPAQHVVVVATVVTVPIHLMIPTHLIIRRPGITRVAVVAEIAPEEALSHVSRGLFLLFYTRMPRSAHSHRYVRMSRSARSYPTFVTFFFVTLGMIGKERLRSCTVCLRLIVSRFGSVKKMCC